MHLLSTTRCPHTHQALPPCGNRMHCHAVTTPAHMVSQQVRTLLLLPPLLLGLHLLPPQCLRAAKVGHPVDVPGGAALWWTGLRHGLHCSVLFVLLLLALLHMEVRLVVLLSGGQPREDKPYNTQVHTSVHTYACTYIRMCVRTYVLYVCMHIRMYVCMYVCTYIRMYVRMYVCMYVCVYVCMYVCNTYRYTHILYRRKWLQ